MSPRDHPAAVGEEGVCGARGISPRVEAQRAGRGEAQGERERVAATQRTRDHPDEHPGVRGLVQGGLRPRPEREHPADAREGARGEAPERPSLLQQLVAPRRQVLRETFGSFHTHTISDCS